MLKGTPELLKHSVYTYIYSSISWCIPQFIAVTVIAMYHSKLDASYLTV
jgi:hypothetical protein